MTISTHFNMFTFREFLVPFVLFRLLLDSCPEGFVIGGYLGSCYRVFPTAVDISTAKAACTSMHSKARLVSIESDAEFDFLRRHYQYLYENEGECTTGQGFIMFLINSFVVRNTPFLLFQKLLQMSIV